MSSLNKVQIISRLGKDPEIRYAPSGVAIANVNAATSRSWKDKQTGEKQEETEWHRLVAYDRLAEVIGEYLKKGSLAYFEGRLKTRKWEDKEGVTRYTTEIVVDQMVMLGGGQQQGDAADRPPAPAAPPQRSSYADAKAGRPPAPAPAAAKTGGSFDDMDDDIPF